jgi:hypothetical protein
VRWNRPALQLAHYATPIETHEERALFFRLLEQHFGGRAPSRGSDGWHEFAGAYNAEVVAAEQCRSACVDPVLRMKRADHLQAFSKTVTDRLRAAHAVASNAAAAVERCCDAGCCADCAAGCAGAAASATPCDVAGAAAHIDVNGTPRSATHAAAGGHLRGTPCMCREECPHQHEVRQGYPTEGPLHGDLV